MYSSSHQSHLLSSSLQDVITLRELSLDFHRKRHDIERALKTVNQNMRKESSSLPFAHQLQDAFHYNVGGRLIQVSLPEASQLLDQDLQTLRSEIDNLTSEIKSRLLSLNPEEDSKLKALIRSHRLRGTGITQGSLEFALRDDQSTSSSNKKQGDNKVNAIDSAIFGTDSNVSVTTVDWEEQRDRTLMMQIDSSLGLVTTNDDESSFQSALNPYASKKK
jgi:chaperonin cofactor prefoldin